MQPCLDPFDLARRQPLCAGPKRVADSIQRVVFAATVAELLLLHPPAGFFHGLQSEADHVERVQHGNGVVELVADRVAVATERVQRGGATPRRSRGTQPVA